jgi:hypothetical protein
MQYSPVYLYPNVIMAYTNALDSLSGGFRKVYQRTLKIYRGTDNKLDLQVRNGDQKAIDISGNYLVFNLFSRETQELLLKKDCIETNDSSLSKGKISVLLTESELADIEPSFYNFTVHIETRETIGVSEYRVISRTPLYVDSQFGAIGTIDIRGEIDGLPKDSNEYIAFKKYVDFTNQDTWYTSSIIDANRSLSTSSSQHTFQFYTNDLIGNIEIQASLEKGASPNTWTTVKEIVRGDSSGSFDKTFYENIEGKFSFFRIKYTPISGTIDKILYR